MSRKKLLVIVIAAILVVGVGAGVYITSPGWMPQGTSLSISPGTATANAGDNLAFSASIKAGSISVSGGSITWAVTGGVLDKTSGTTVIFTAPTSDTDTSVTITASFGGVGVYQSSSATAKVTVHGTGGSTTTTTTTKTTTSTTSSTNAPSPYTMKFSTGSMTNVKLTGPIIMNGTSVTMLTATTANMVGFTLSHFGLTAQSMNVGGLSLYLTSMTGTSSALGGTLAITGTQHISQGPVSSASLTNFTMSVLRMEGTNATFTGMISIAQQVGGSEPYIPSVITAPSVSMTKTYYIGGPVTWGALTGAASNITTGRIDLPQFSFQVPMTYTLDRHARTFTADYGWTMTATSATALNVRAFTVYFQVTGGEMVQVTATGSDNVYNMIPFGLNQGGSFSGWYATVQPVYFSASQLTLGGFVLSVG